MTWRWTATSAGASASAGAGAGADAGESDSAPFALPFCGEEQSLDRSSRVDVACPEVISAIFGVLPGDLVKGQADSADAQGVILVKLSARGVARSRMRGLVNLADLCETLGGEAVVVRLSQAFYTR